MKKKIPYKDFFHLTIPLIIGIIIYLLYRGIPFLNIEKFFIAQSNRENFFSLFLYYNLPDGLWLYSLLVTLKIVWNKQLLTKGRYWIYAIISFAILSEFAQKLKIIPGTFDYLDILAYLIAISVFSYRNKHLFNYKINYV